MKALYIGDNRVRHNWGCRATSIALKRLIEQEFEIVGQVDEKETLNGFTPTFYNNLFIPTWLLKKLWNKRNRRVVKKLFYIYNIIGGKKDYLSKDISGSADFIIKNRTLYSHLDKIYNQVQNADVVIINGEGTYIFSFPTRRDLLFFQTMIELAKKLGKKVYLVNAMFSKAPNGKTDQELIDDSVKILQKCDFISARDPWSFEFLKSLKLTQVQYHPDALFTWRRYLEAGLNWQQFPEIIIPFPESDGLIGHLDFKRDYVCIAGSSIVGKNREKEAIQFITKLTQSLVQKGLQVYLVETCVGDSYLRKIAKSLNVVLIPKETSVYAGFVILSNAKVFLSGRYHPSIMASLGGTPCVFFNSNSHKTRSLQEILDYENKNEFSIFDNLGISKILYLVEGFLSDNEIHRNRIIQRVNLLETSSNSLFKSYEL